MTTPLRWPSSLVLAVVSLAAASCGRPYSADQVPGLIEHISAEEYRLDVSVRHIDHTIAVYLRHDGVLEKLGEEVGLSPEAGKPLNDLTDVLHRVLLSTNADIDFYFIIVSDSQIPGAYLTLIRSLEDVRRLSVSVIPPTEFLMRTVIDLKYDVAVPILNFDQLVVKDIELGQFLSWQMSRRIQMKLIEHLEEMGLTPEEVGPCVGEFQNGEFTFLLNIAPVFKWRNEEELVQQAFQDATEVIAEVLSSYQFEDFSAIRLSHPASGRSLLLPKTELRLLGNRPAGFGHLR